MAECSIKFLHSQSSRLKQLDNLEMNAVNSFIAPILVGGGGWWLAFNKLPQWGSLHFLHALLMIDIYSNTRHQQFQLLSVMSDAQYILIRCCQSSFFSVVFLQALFANIWCWWKIWMAAWEVVDSKLCRHCRGGNYVWTLAWMNCRTKCLHRVCVWLVIDTFWSIFVQRGKER